MQKTYAILGAGMQGTAAAYDLARFGDAHEIRLGDAHLDQATKSAERVNLLVGRAACVPFQVNALDPEELSKFITGCDALCSCVPYWMHPRIAKVAIAARVHMADLGGNTAITMETLALHDEALTAGVTLVPDTGLAPGLVNSVGLWMIEQLDEVESIKLMCGVLPQHPIPPFNYKLTFNIEGLVTEYDYQAVVLRDGEIHLVDTLSEIETIELDELGTMEVFTTSGGTSTAPNTLQGRVKNYEYKTIRWPGHAALMRIFKDNGFWSETPVDVRGTMVKPLDVFCKVFGDSLKKIEDLDQCVVRGIGIGTKDGQPKRIQVDLFDKQCETTGFTAMERTTGFSIAIHAIEMAHGRLPHGALKYETAMTGAKFCEEIRHRGIRLSSSTY